MVSVRSTNKFFRLPTDPDTTPILMLCAGSGLAPFRGFLQERAVLIKEGGRKLAPALLFVGCRSSTGDRLYGEELDAWVKEGVVDVRYAFSREPDHPVAEGCARVPDRMLKDREDVYKMFFAGAKFYTCGSGEFAKALGEAGKTLVRDKIERKGNTATQEQLEEWFQKRRNERFVSDIFS